MDVLLSELWCVPVIETKNEISKSTKHLIYITINLRQGFTFEQSLHLCGQSSSEVNT